MPTGRRVPRPIARLAFLLGTGLALSAPAHARTDTPCADQQLRFSIPYQWSRPPGDEERVQIRRTLHTAATLAFARQGLPDWDRDGIGLEIRSATLTGYSSPESTAGPQSLALDALDPVNLRVARARAEAIRADVALLFAPRGLSNDAISTSGDERQFSDDQWALLHREAGGTEAVDGAYDAAAVYALIERFKNDRDALTAEQRATVAAALADKKAVEITLCYGASDPAPEAVASIADAAIGAPGNDTLADNADTSASEAGPEIVHPIIRELGEEGSESADSERAGEVETDSPPKDTAVRTRREAGESSAATSQTDRIRAFIDQYALALGIGAAVIIGLIIAIALMLRRTALMRLEAEALPRRKRRPWNAPHARITAIMSGKGGTGKSSISSSLAFALAHTGYRTLLVDLDLFTHGLTFLNQGRLPRRWTIFSDMLENSPALPWPRVLDAHADDLKEIPAAAGMTPRYDGASVDIFGFGRLHSSGRPALAEGQRGHLVSLWRAYFSAQGATRVRIGQRLP
ncbi:MAG: P-loop NTPase [Gammaproteobacteria bacterium]